MAESKLTDKAALTTPASGDILYIVDVSDTTDDPTGSSKKITGSDLFKLAPVTSVASKTGAVVLASTDIFRTGTSGDSVDTDLTAIESDVTAIKARLKYTGTTTDVEVDASNKFQIDSGTSKAVLTVGGTTAATMGATRSDFPALRVGASGSNYDLPTSRGTTTGQVPVFNATTNATTFQALKVQELSGNTDDLVEGATNLYFTTAERSKLTGIAAGAEVNVNADWNATSGDAQILNKPTVVTQVTGTSPIVSSGGTTPAISIPASSAVADGYMSSSQWTKLDGIEAGAQVNDVSSVNAQTGAVVLDTDDVLEGTTNKYFTDARADARTLAEKNQTLTGPRTIDLAGETLDMVYGTDTVFSASDGITVRELFVYGLGTTNPGRIVLQEATANGSHYIELKAPASLAAATNYTLPSADGTSGQVLKTDGAGVMSWVTKKVTQVTSKTVATGAWSLVSGVYEASISDGAILSTSIVDVIPDNASASTVRTAEVLPRTDSSTGSVKIYATNAPAASITVTLNIFDL